MKKKCDPGRRVHVAFGLAVGGMILMLALRTFYRVDEMHEIITKFQNWTPVRPRKSR